MNNLNEYREFTIEEIKTANKGAAKFIVVQHAKPERDVFMEFYDNGDVANEEAKREWDRRCREGKGQHNTRVYVDYITIDGLYDDAFNLETGEIDWCDFGDSGLHPKGFIPFDSDNDNTFIALNVLEDAKNNNPDAVKTFLENNKIQLENNEKVLIAAAKLWLGNLEHASDELKDDYSFMERAIEEVSADALQYASDDLKGDEDLVTIAVEKDKNALQWADDYLKNDEDFLKRFED